MCSNHIIYALFSLMTGLTMIFILFIALLCSDSIFNLLKIVADDAINKSDLENSSQYFLKDEFKLSQSR